MKYILITSKHSSATTFKTGWLFEHDNWSDLGRQGYVREHCIEILAPLSKYFFKGHVMQSWFNK